MAIGLARSRAARLAEVGANAGLAERNELADVGAHGVGEAHDHFEVGAHAGSCWPVHQPQVAVSIGTVPDFPRLDAGKITLASWAVAVRNMS